MQNLIDVKNQTGSQLRLARVAKGKRLVDVQVDTGMGEKNICCLEQGKSNFCIDTLHRYATYLGGKLKIEIEWNDNTQQQIEEYEKRQKGIEENK